MPRAWAVVPAAGSGSRMGAGVAKQYLPLRGQPLLAHSLAPLLASERIEAVVLVVAPDDSRWRAVVPDSERLLTAAGGVQRCHSVLNGLERLAGHAAADDWVLVHDAARPCLSPAELETLFAQLGDHPVGGLLALPLADTLKTADEHHCVSRTLSREGLWRALTPQMFRYGLLREALGQAIAAGMLVTDEAAAMEHAGYRPALVTGRAANIKVTTPEDLALADAVLGRRGGRAMRVGHGFDVHAFGPGDRVVIGGVEIEHDRGVVAHSDGDVALHALCDALLGAAGLGDIGGMFPDSEARWAGADSRDLLRRVVARLGENGLQVDNADLTLVAQAPRLAPHIGAMRARIAADLEVAEERVNIKATTTERLGYVGRGEGLAAHAIVLLQESP